LNITGLVIGLEISSKKTDS